MSMAERLEGLSPEEQAAVVNREAWLRGDLWHLLLDGGQTVAYEEIHAWREANPKHSGPVVLNCHRGLGKTALEIILALECSLKAPGMLARIAGPELKEIRGAAEPTLRLLMRKRPAEIEVDAYDDGYRIFNPRTMKPGEFSILSYVGLRELGDKRRGLRADFICVDEARNIPNLSYVIDSVLRPMFATRVHPFMVIASTSPTTGGHELWDYIDRAESHKRYVFIPVTKNTAWAEKSPEELESVFGPVGSISWNREAMCARVGDENLLALPSFTRNKDRIKRAAERPEYFLPFVFGDMGFIDCAAFLFAYIDYGRQKLVVEDELVRPSLGSDQLHAELLRMERELFAGTHHYNRIRRWCDATPRELDDLRRKKLYFQPARTGDEKWDKWQGLARLESLFAAERVEIHPRCKSLCHQCENAIKNKYRTDLERELPKSSADPNSPTMGHQDALWALAYGVWHVRPAWLQSPHVTKEPTEHIYSASRRREDEPAQWGTVEITHRPLIITEDAAHIIGAVSDARRKLGGRRVTY